MIECFKCGGEMEARVAAVEGEYDGEKFTVETEALACKMCGFTTVDRPHLDEYYTKVADAYRTKRGLLTSQQILSIRERMGMSQEEFAEFLCVGIASVKRWEHGKAQEPAKDRLIRLQTDSTAAESNYIRTLLNQGGPADEFSGWQHFNLEKFEQAVLFFLHRLPKREGGRDFHIPLLINKLTWFSDAEHVRRHGKSITGTRYARIGRGPVPDNYVQLYRVLEEDKTAHYTDAETLVPLAEFRPGAFTKEEFRTLESVWERFKDRLAQIEDDSHQEKAWRETPHAKIISFQLVEGKVSAVSG